MAKRFTDADKWKKPFIRGLQGAYKLLWFYILDDCDHAGIWQVDFDVAQIRIGVEVEEKQALLFFIGKVISFSNGEKWLIPDFIEFQYGNLNPENRAHNSVINLLKKYHLIDEENKVLISSLQGAKDKEQDKDMDKVKDKEAKSEIYRQFQHLKISVIEFKKLTENGYGQKEIDSTLDAIENYAKNKNYTSLNLTVRKWMDKQRLETVPQKGIRRILEINKQVKNPFL